VHLDPIHKDTKRFLTDADDVTTDAALDTGFVQEEKQRTRRRHQRRRSMSMTEIDVELALATDEIGVELAVATDEIDGELALATEAASNKRNLVRAKLQKEVATKDEGQLAAGAEGGVEAGLLAESEGVAEPAGVVRAEVPSSSASEASGDTAPTSVRHAQASEVESLRFLGVNLAHGQIAICVCDNEGTVLGKEAAPLNDATFENATLQIAVFALDLLQKLELSTDDISAIGVGMPGTVDFERG
jgi:hypothetical protein